VKTESEVWKISCGLVRGP